jgi:hypothetical protein
MNVSFAFVACAGTKMMPGERIQKAEEDVSTRQRVVE